MNDIKILMQHFWGVLKIICRSRLDTLMWISASFALLYYTALRLGLNVHNYAGSRSMSSITIYMTWVISLILIKSMYRSSDLKQDKVPVDFTFYNGLWALCFDIMIAGILVVVSNVLFYINQLFGLDIVVGGTRHMVQFGFIILFFIPYYLVARWYVFARGFDIKKALSKSLNMVMGNYFPIAFTVVLYCIGKFLFVYCVSVAFLNSFIANRYLFIGLCTFSRVLHIVLLSSFILYIYMNYLNKVENIQYKDLAHGHKHREIKGLHLP